MEAAKEAKCQGEAASKDVVEWGWFRSFLNDGYWEIYQWRDRCLMGNRVNRVWKYCRLGYVERSSKLGRYSPRR